LTSSSALDNLSPMERFLQRVRPHVRRLLLDPLLRPVFDRFDRLEGRLDHLEGRLDDLQGLLEQVSARTSARSEASLAVTESVSRTARRIDEIERILGAR
jgi:hypothetical protein